MLKSKIKSAIKVIEESYISEYSAQCSFFIILSFIPFIILLLTLIKYLGLDKETLYGIIYTMVPYSINDKVLDIIQEVYSKSIGTVSVSVIFIIWSAGKGFFALCKGMNSIYKVQKKYNYFSLKIRSIICTIGFILTIIITLVIFVFGNKINIFINEHFEKIAHIANMFFNFSKIIVFVILFSVFLIIYRFVPKHKAKIKKQIPGAVFSSVGWLTISNAFSFYIEKKSGYSIMYGSLTTVMWLFIWIYFCIYILLLGAVINKELERRKK